MRLKFNVFLTIISIVLTVLLGYWIYDTAKDDKNGLLCGILSSTCLLFTLIPLIGLQYNNGRIGVNSRVLSGIFLIIFLISHFFFAFYGVIMPTYLIINGILLLIYFALFYKLQTISFN